MSLNIDINQSNLHSQSSQDARSKGQGYHISAWQGCQNPNLPIPRIPRIPRSPALPNPNCPTIPNPQIFCGLTGLENSESAGSASSITAIKDTTGDGTRSLGVVLPTVAECAAHLELLECIVTLRAKVLSSTTLDRAFSIKSRLRTVTQRRGEFKLDDSTFNQRRMQKWPVFLNMAAERFMIWVKTIDNELSNTRREREQCERLFPPPLDILMVWHALLLNPKYYEKLCQQLHLRFIQQIKFPWKQVHEAISADLWLFHVPEPTMAQLDKLTNLDSDLYLSIIQHSAASVIAPELAKLIDPSIPPEQINKGTPTESLSAKGRTLYHICQEGSKTKADIQELSAAVTRQLVFAQKMERQLWIRSPTLEGTMKRIIGRYGNFLQLFKLYPKTMLVPTLDIDLVWHTHQLSHARYRQVTEQLVGTLIDHNDKLGKPVLDDGMQRTKNLYRIRFGEEYQICNCWDCEALTSALEEAEDDDAGETETDTSALARRVAAEVSSYRLVEMARRARKSDLQNDSWNCTVHLEAPDTVDQPSFRDSVTSCKGLV